MKNLYKIKIGLLFNAFCLMSLFTFCTKYTTKFANRTKINFEEHKNFKNQFINPELETDDFIIIEKTPSPSFSISSNNDTKDEIENKITDKIEVSIKKEKSKDNTIEKVTKQDTSKYKEKDEKSDICLNLDEDEKSTKFSNSTVLLKDKINNINPPHSNNCNDELYSLLTYQNVILNREDILKKVTKYNNQLPKNIEFNSNYTIDINQKKLFEDFQRIFENCVCIDKSQSLILEYLLKFKKLKKNNESKNNVEDTTQEQTFLPFTTFIGDLHNLLKPNWSKDKKDKYQFFSYRNLVICITYSLKNNIWHYNDLYIQCEKCKKYNTKKGSIFPKFATEIFQKYNTNNEYGFKVRFKKLYKIAKPFNFNTSYKFYFLEDFRYNKKIIENTGNNFKNNILNLLSNKNNIHIILPYYLKNTGETKFFYIFLKENKNKYIILNLYTEGKKYLIKDVLDFNSKYFIHTFGKASTYLVIHGNNFYNLTK